MKHLFAFCLFALVPLSAAASADVLTLTPSKDNTLYEDTAGLISNGSGDYFFAGTTNGAELRRGVLAFDVAGAVPAGSTINSVTLQMYMSRTMSGTKKVDLHALLADWGEGTSDASGEEGGGTNAAASDATWIHAFFSGSLWSAAGGDFSPSVTASTSVGGVGFYSWTSGPMVTTIQSWLDAPAGNLGWIAIGDEGGGGSSKRFDSRSNPVIAQRPMLTIDYTPTGGTGACCMPDGTCIDGVSATDCTNLGGTYQGDGTDCLTTSCPIVTGACCFADGTCTDITGAACATAGGTYQGDGTDCMTSACPIILEPFVDALPLPAVAQPTTGTAGGAGHYDIDITQFQQQLHRDLPPTTVWGYGGTYPGPTIEARSGVPITVTWINDLRDAMGNLRTDHYLPVDLCPHGPDTEGDNARTVVHLHGGHIAAEFDGYPEDTFLPGEQDTYQFSNWQDAATLWYHDHAVGITRLNVTMGLAGFYLIRNDEEDALNLPSGEFEVPLAIQDRTFKADGNFEYPAAWQQNWFGDTPIVNGMVSPFHNVKQGKYRFRFLNGSSSRFWTMGLTQGLSFTVIGSDGGLLEQPVVQSEFTFAPGERLDVVVDFSGLAPGTEVILTNTANTPFPNGAANDIPEVMKFIVTGQVGHTAAIPADLRTIEPLVEADAVNQRDFELRRFNEPCAGTNWLINGLGWNDITEFPELETSEVWSFINRSGMTHPMHMHLVFFQVLDRQAFTVVGGVVTPNGPVMPPDPDEVGWKDTVRARPFEITRVIARFADFTGKYAYHCHILEHEDHEMMRQFEIPTPDGSFCNGDGGDQTGCRDCPCGNNAPIGKIGGCLNSQNRSAFLYQGGVPSVGSDSLRFQMTGAPVGSFAVMLSGDSQAPTNAANPCFAQNPGSGIGAAAYDGHRCILQGIKRHGGRATDGDGNIGLTNSGWGPPDGPPIGLVGQGGFMAGQTRHFQVVYRDLDTKVCMRGLNTSQGVSVTFVP